MKRMLRIRFLWKITSLPEITNRREQSGDQTIDVKFAFNVAYLTNLWGAYFHEGPRPMWTVFNALTSDTIPVMGICSLRAPVGKTLWLPESSTRYLSHCMGQPKEQLLQTCFQACQAWDLNSWPLHYLSNILTTRSCFYK